MTRKVLVFGTRFPPELLGIKVLGSSRMLYDDNVSHAFRMFKDSTCPVDTLDRSSMSEWLRPIVAYGSR